MIRQYTERLEAWFGDRDVYLETCLKMVLILLLLFVQDIPWDDMLVPLLVVPGLLVRRIAFSPYYWLVISATFVLFYLVLGLQHYLPNHKYNFTFLILSVTLALFARENDEDWPRLLRKLARWVIGFCFLYATIGKFLAPEFLDGSFFEFTCLTDERFHGMTSVVTGIGTTELYGGYQSFMQLLATSDPSMQIGVLSNPMLKPAGLFLAYWTIFIEGMIAITYLAPRGSWLNRRREWFLLLFIITTYPIATVPGFATMLACAAFIQSFHKGKPTLFSLFYLLLFMAVPLFKLPFLRIFDLIF